MAVPKRRVSHTRSAKRRTHYKISLQKPVKDTNGTWKMPHKTDLKTGSITKGLTGIRNNSDEDILRAIKEIARVS